MNRAVPLSRSGESDPLAVNSTTLHQYYNTVQSDTDADHHMVDAAMSRRQAMAVQAYRRKSRSGWVVAAAALLVLAGFTWFFR